MIAVRRIAITGFLAIFFGSLSAQLNERPNVILIYSDDQGTIDLNCYGAKDLYTPHLDQLASKGVRFTQFYAGSSVCSPSRAALLTGMSPQAAGLPGNTSSQRGDPGMPGDRITIAEMLKEAGYATGHIGKWHLGYSAETRPMAQGFDYTFGHMGGCIDNYSHYFYWNGPNRHDLWENGIEVYREGEYFPDLMVEKAAGFMEAHRAEPFFLYFAINLPHYPLQPTEKWRTFYKDLGMPRRDYAGFISVVDEKIGQLLEHLERLGIKENTIIIFQSDQGHSCEIRTFGGGGNSGVYRGAKSSLFEGGIRVPAIISWPEHLPQGQVNDVACINYDWFPTIAELCGIKSVPPTVEGRSLLPVITDHANSQHAAFHWKLGRQWAVRKGNWKLIGNPTDPSHKFPLDGDSDQLFLVDLDIDPSESNNLYFSKPEIVRELIELYLNWDYGYESDIPEEPKSFNNIAYGSKIELAIEPDAKYSAGGAQSLINNKLGSGNFADGQWLGFEGNDLIANIELKDSHYIESIKIRALQETERWIFLPTKINIFLSESQDLSKPDVQFITVSDDLRKEFQVREFDFSINKKARYLKFEILNVGDCPDWHPGKGQAAWLFIDEIIIE